MNASEDQRDDVVEMGGTARHALQEVPRPALMATGRLRLVDFPVSPTAIGRVERMQLETHTYRKATALPLERRTGSNRVRGAVYSRRSRLVRDTERAIGQPGGHWHSNQRRFREPVPPQTVRLPGRSFFLGHWSPGFGHVLLEMLPRLWPLQDLGRYDNFILYPRRTDATPVMESTTWLRELLDLCGIALGKVVVVREPLRVEMLDVTTPPFILKRAADPRFLNVFESIRQRVLAAGRTPAARDLPRRIYLSRSQLPTRVALNEADVEGLMQRRGFTVLHPQQMTIADQVAVLAHVEVIAGTDGSALHAAVFARPGTKLLALDSRGVPSQLLIDRVRGLDAVHVLARDEAVHRRATWSADVASAEAALDLLLMS